MSGLPNTVRVHQALARCCPEPLDSRQLRELLGMSPRQLESARVECLKAGVIRRVRALGTSKGYGYTVVVS